MARNGSGTYSLAAGNPVVTGTTISSTTHNNTMSDIATALTDSLAKDGQTTPTADLPMGTYKHTGVGNAAARNQYAAVGQAQDQSFTWCSTAGGTADVFTLTPSPAITAYAAGQAFAFLAVGTNTTNVTCNVSGVGAKAVQASGSALAGGEIVSGKLYSVRYDGTQFQLEAVSVTPFIATLLNDATAAAARTTLGIDSGFPSGTKMLFQQTSAPTGWTKDTTHNDKSLRIVSGAASSGGATAFTSVFGSSKTTGSHTLDITEIPAHTHTTIAASANQDDIAGGASGVYNGSGTTGSAGGGGGHTHTLSLDLQYVDVIIATKD